MSRSPELKSQAGWLWEALVTRPGTRGLCRAQLLEKPSLCSQISNQQVTKPILFPRGFVPVKKVSFFEQVLININHYLSNYGRNGKKPLNVGTIYHISARRWSFRGLLKVTLLLFDQIPPCHHFAQGSERRLWDTHKWLHRHMWHLCSLPQH